MPIVCQNETYAIIGAAMQVYNKLGRGFLEAVYQEALAIELKKVFIQFEREKEITIYYDGQPLEKKYQADFVCCNKIIVELKAVSGLNDSHKAQLYNYLRATQKKVGLLINFGSEDGLQWERLVM